MKKRSAVNFLFCIKHFGPDRPYTNMQRLVETHESIAAAALNQFNTARKIGGDEFAQTYREELLKELSERLGKKKKGLSMKFTVLHGLFCRILQKSQRQEENFRFQSNTCRFYYDDDFKLYYRWNSRKFGYCTTCVYFGSFFLDFVCRSICLVVH